MASTIILSDNGASSGSAGVKTTGGNDGVLILQTTTSGGTATAGITINNIQGVLVPNTIGVGGATPSTSGAGITFPATQSASTDVNTLDDYEEGTWTPAITTDGSGASITYTTQVGKYTKIGNCVTVDCEVTWSARSGGSGNVLLSGFPFGITSNQYSCRFIATASIGTGLASNATIGWFTATLSGQTGLYFYAVNSTAPLSSTALTGSGIFAFKGHYYV